MSTSSTKSTKSAKSAKSAKSTKSVTSTLSEPTPSTEVAMSTVHHPVPVVSADPAVSPAAPVARSAPLPVNPLVASLPSEQAVSDATAQLDVVSTLLGENATRLTTQQRRHSLKFKTGGEPYVALLARLALQYDLKLPGVDPKQMQANILLVQRLEPLDAKLRTAGSLVSDTLLNAKAGAWQGTTALYTALLRASRNSSELQKELEPAKAFFKKPKAAPSAGATPAAPKKPTARSVELAKKVLAREAAANGEAQASGATPVAAPAAAAPAPGAEAAK